MKRREWEIEYTGARLAEAAEEKSHYHRERLNVWMTSKDEVMENIRESGMEISETLVDEMRKTGSYTTQGSFGPTVTIRADLLQKLSEAHTKVVQHEQLVKDYDAWMQMMGAHTELRFKLQHDDWMFFFGR